MPNPWSEWIKFWEKMNLEGRAKFERLATDDERTTATVINVAMMAGLFTAIVAGLYFILFMILLLLMWEDDGSGYIWLAIFGLLFYALKLGWIQGGALGAILGFGQAQLWQGKRNKAGTICALGGATVLSLMALWELQFYRPEVPVSQFLFWAILLFSPGYLVSSCLISYGLKLLND